MASRTLLISMTALAFAASAQAARIDFVKHANRIDVTADGKPFTSYLYKIDPAKPMVAGGILLTKPILFPVYSPSGTMMTRGYPLLDIPGEAKDHPHHMGVYFTVDVNDDHFWGNSKSPLPRIEHKETTEMTPGLGRGVLATVAHWIGRDGKVTFVETRRMTFIAEKPDQYAIDFDITLTAADKTVTVGDTKEGMMAVRVAPWLKEQGGTGRYLSSEGQEMEKGVWGKRARWMRLQGQTDGKTYGIAILNHPESTNYPTYWHARGYGCFTANPLGQGAFQKSHKEPDAKNLDLTLVPGQSAAFKHRMIFYEGPRTAKQIEAEFADYTAAGLKLVYSQDFDDPASIRDFEFTTPGKWTWSDKGNGSGALEHLGPGDYQPKVRSPIVIGLISDRMFGDFVLECDLLQTGREYGHRDACVFFNFQDPSHFYYAHIATAADPHAHNIFIVNDQPRTAIAAKTTKGVNWGSNVWHKVRIERKLADGSIKVFYDDMTEPIMTAVDKTFGPGYIGFGTFDDSGKIDNIRIYASQMQEKPSSFFPKK
ncbi:MAG TPA: PmoA family protein [Anaerohalosphaeraceae bacterium]|jgi:hypothetical protein|nr:PmoA family protein [Anaerohalosphaeraceae bacterium]HRT49297.1 PmoA family protein [Anaerohalosphaeraceae bacterium]HRT85164.1 PmoA family protein [Anaerohalosphaeraceae bacterium]